MTDTRVRCAILSFGFGMSLIAAGGCSSVSEDGKSWAATALEGDVLENLTELEQVTAQPETEEGSNLGTAKQALIGTHKFCSVIAAPNFRDTIVVDNGWTGENCRQYCNQVGASTRQLGCFFDSTFSIGASIPCSLTTTSRPPSNCGW